MRQTDPTKESGMGGQFMTEPHDHGDRFSDACLICVRAERDALREAANALIETRLAGLPLDGYLDDLAEVLERPE